MNDTINRCGDTFGGAAFVNADQVPTVRELYLRCCSSVLQIVNDAISQILNIGIGQISAPIQTFMNHHLDAQIATLSQNFRYYYALMFLFFFRSTKFDKEDELLFRIKVCSFQFIHKGLF